MNSELLGENGEKWSPTSRLADFSRSGYHFGNRTIKNVVSVTNLKEFGATENGKAEDSSAFNKAINPVDERGNRDTRRPVCPS